MGGKIAAIFARVSSPGQEAQSPEGQVAEVKPWLEEQGWIVPEDKIVKVVWSSLDMLRCPETELLLNWARNGDIGAIGLWHIDRLSGEPADKLILKKEFDRHGVTLLPKNSPMFQGREGELWDFLSTWEKKGQVLRTQIGAKKGLRDRAQLKGLPPTTTKDYGYKWETRKFGPDEDYNNACLIWELALSAMKLKAMCKELVVRGIATPNGKVYWQPSSLRAILTNPIYAGRIGTLRYEKVEPKHRRKNTFGKTSFRVKPIDEWHFLEGLVECPIVTWEQYLAVQERLRLNKQYASRNAHRDYLLRGIIQCQACYGEGIDRHYYGVQRTSQKPAYVCSAAWAQTYGKKCRSKAIPCPRIEEAVKAKIRSFLEDPQIYFSEIQARSQITEKTIADIEEAIRDNERQFQKTIADERRKADLLTPEAFRQEQALIKAKRIWLQGENERLTTKLANLQKHNVQQDMVQKIRENLSANLDRATNEDWRFILESLGTKIIAYGDGTWDIEINIPVPAELIANKTPWCTSPCSRPGIRQSLRGCRRCGPLLKTIPLLKGISAWRSLDR